ncbi:MAG: DUF4349 domain-containing protein [Chloroflexi bacterium]|nr:DUF4349 domain-containing protein [Chloroflexota bacterium]
MPKRIALLVVIALLILSGCSSPAKYADESYTARPAAPSAGMGAAEMPAAASEAADSGVPGAQLPVQRMVIRDANLTIIVQDPASAMNEIIRMAEERDGYVVSSNLYKTHVSSGVEVPEARITIRVPADQLNATLNQIKALVENPKDVSNESISGQDVTKEYTDLNSRLRNLEQAEAQLREIMASATYTEDVLAVYRQLTEIREEIEVIKGQIQFYEDSAALSSITVNIESLAALQPLEVAGWRPEGVARDAVQALINTMQFLGSAAIWLILYVLPVLLVISIPIWLLWKLVRRALKSGKPPVQAPPPPPQTQG